MSNSSGSSSSLAPDSQGSSTSTVPTTPLARIIDLTARVATSWVGLLTAYIGAVTAAVIAFRKLAEPLAGWPVWSRIALVAALPVLVFVTHTIPTIIDQRRKKRLSEITGTLKAGYFRLAPREEEESFTRADGKHDEILEWLIKRDQAKVLYLTGASGSGKSSLLLLDQRSRSQRFEEYEQKSPSQLLLDQPLLFSEQTDRVLRDSFMIRHVRHRRVH